MRLATAPIFLLPALLLAGCDTGSTPKGQAPDSAPAKQAEKGEKTEIGLESKNGLTAALSYASAGKKAPDAVFTGSDGREVRLSDFAGRPLLVNLWATWCAPCKAEMPTLDALAALEEGKTSVVAVSQDLEGRKPVAAFFAASKIANLEPYTDPDNALMAAYGANVVLPMTILYDSGGREVWRVTGGVEWDDAEMGKLIAEAG